MSSRTYTTIFYSLAALCAVLSVIFLVTGKINMTGWATSLFFVCIALAFRGSTLLQRMSFTAIIFASVTLAMFHPQYFITWGDYKLSNSIIPLIQVLMFGMGSSMGFKDFAIIE